MRHVLPPLALAASLLLFPLPAAAQRALPLGPKPLRPTSGPELWVSGYTSAAVHRFGARDGEPLGTIPGVAGAQSVREGPDGLLYVVAEELDQVLRVRGNKVLEVFVGDDPGTPVDEDGPLNAPTAAVFGPGGHLYVASFANDRVLRYDGTTGLYLDTFVPARSNGLSGPDAGMVWGPDGLLYVPSFNSNAILRFDADGVFVDRFANQANGNLRNPRMILFRPNGDLWVSSWGSNSILAYAPDKTFLGRIVGVTRPTGFAVGPDDGMLYVTSDQTDRVNRFDLLTGQFSGLFVPPSAGIEAGTYLHFVQRY